MKILYSIATLVAIFAIFGIVSYFAFLCSPIVGVVSVGVLGALLFYAIYKFIIS